MYQDGSIMPRLNELGTEVSSAEQMLQEINQRLQSAESTLGEGGAMQTSAIGSGFMQPVSMNNPQAPDLRAIPEPMKDPSYQPPQMALPENPMSGGLMQSPLAGAMRNMAASGGMMGRQLYGLGSLVKSVTKGIKGAVKGVAKTVKKNPLLAAAAFNFAPMLIPGGASTFLGGSKAMFGLPSLSGIFSKKGAAGKFFGGDATLGKTAAMFAGGTLLGSLASAVESGDEEAVAATRDVNALRSYLEKGYRNLNYSEDEIPALVESDVAEYSAGQGGYANGGRIGYADGTEFEEYLKGREEFNKKQNAEQLYKEFLENKRRQKVAEQKTMAANGGRIGYAFGTPEQNAIEAAGIMNLPLNQNPAGVTELDLRETGGFIPPVGVKEKADDIPAMLANNEFVFTADAVRGMGDGNVNKGAQRMYDMMKKLEKGGRV